MSRTEKRKYTKSKAIDPSCRGRGGCPWCVGNRNHVNDKRIMAAKQRIVDAAIRWGESPSELGDYESQIESLAKDIGLSMAIGELDDAISDRPPRFTLEQLDD